MYSKLELEVQFEAPHRGSRLYELIAALEEKGIVHQRSVTERLKCGFKRSISFKQYKDENSNSLELCARDIIKKFVERHPGCIDSYDLRKVTYVANYHRTSRK